jgi:hypothetical protein
MGIFYLIAIIIWDGDENVFDNAFEQIATKTMDRCGGCSQVNSPCHQFNHVDFTW